jgi:hypothetical protein
MPYRIVLRQDTSANWALNNPTLLSGEFGFATDTNQLKLGDGVSPWNSLEYYHPGPTGDTGATGAIGPQGTTGDQGVTGPTGTREILTNQESTNYTLQLSDAYSHVQLGSSSNLTLTVPTNSAIPFETGTNLLVSRGGTGAVQIIGATGVTVNSSVGATANLTSQYSVGNLLKTNTNTWLLWGDIS